MKVTTASTRLAELRSASQPAQTDPQPKNPGPDEFQASSPGKHRAVYEAAYNFGQAVDNLTRAASKTGQYFQLSSLALGLQPGGLAGTLALIGGTYDVAIGTSRARQATTDRKMDAAVQGSLRALQGVATYVSVVGPAFGAPGVVGRAAAFVALGALAGRLGMQAVGGLAGLFKGNDGSVSEASAAGTLTQSLGTSAPFEAQAVVKQSEAEKQEEEAASGDSRAFEKLYAANNAVNSFFSRLGGIGAFWNNIEAIWGAQPGSIWGVLGLVGSTYSLAEGAAALRASTVNHNQVGTVDGALHVVQGLASVGSSLGMGRPAGLLAAGAFIGRYAYQIYHQAKEMKDDGSESVGQIVKEAVKNAFLGKPGVDLA